MKSPSLHDSQTSGNSEPNVHDSQRIADPLKLSQTGAVEVALSACGHDDIMCVQVGCAGLQLPECLVLLRLLIRAPLVDTQFSRY